MIWIVRRYSSTYMWYQTFESFLPVQVQAPYRTHMFRKTVDVVPPVLTGKKKLRIWLEYMSVHRRPA